MLKAFDIEALIEILLMQQERLQKKKKKTSNFLLPLVRKA